MAKQLFTNKQMINYLALLRAVNVGKRTVKMAELKALLTHAGFQNVQTYIQSGNVIFKSDERNTNSLRTNLEHLISEKFGFWVDVIIRDKDQMQKVMQNAPFNESEQAEWKQYVCYLNNQTSEEVAAVVESWNNRFEVYHLNGPELYVKLHKSLTGALVRYNQLEKIAKQPSTTRNWQVTQQLNQLIAM